MDQLQRYALLVLAALALYNAGARFVRALDALD